MQIVGVPVPNFRCLGDYCLIYPAVTDLRAINAHLNKKVDSLTAVSMSCTGLTVSPVVLVSV